MQSFGDITTISFDADGTLFDFERVMRASLGIILDQMVKLAPKAAGALTVDDLVAIRDRVADEWRGQGQSHEAIRLEAFRRTLERLRHPNEALAYQLNAQYMRHRFSDIRAYDDVLPALSILRDRFKLGIISNGNSYPDRCGLEGFFQFHAMSQDHGVEKPDPLLFRLAMEEAGCAAEQMLHVGDSLHTDILGARNAGALSVWLNRRGIPNDTGIVVEHELSSLGQLPRLLGIGTADSAPRSSEKRRKGS